MKLGLGSAQFGLDYGITNAGGRTPLPEIKRILEVAARSGIEVIDTAPLYGDAQKALGATFPAGSSFSIVSKIPALGALPTSPSVREAVERSYHESLGDLGRPRLYGLLVHHVEDLLGPEGELLYDALIGLRERGAIQKIGASVYCARDIDAIMRRFPIDIVQAPVSVLDQRLVTSGHLNNLKRAGVEVHARSLFLQGVVLAPPKTLPAHLSGLMPAMTRFQAWAVREGMSPAQAALAFAASVDAIDVALVGVTKLSELVDACAGVRASRTPNWADFAVSEETLLDPRRWPRRPVLSGS